MRTLEFTLTEEQYQHTEEIKYANRIHLSEGVFEGNELCLHYVTRQLSRATKKRFEHYTFK